MIFKNCTFYNEFFEKEFGDIQVENGKITSIGILDDGVDMSKSILIPGFVDIHIHGCGGGDSCDADNSSLDKMTKELALHGVTSFCPTAMTLPQNRLIDIVKTIANYKSTHSKIAGINLEGPYISHAKNGAQNAEYIRSGSIEEFDELYAISNGKIKLITIAPENFESKDFIEYVSKKCVVSIGHSNANSKQTKAAIDSGITHTTHLYNAMTPMTHREPNIVGTALDSDITCELICDGGHICPAVLRNTFKILGDNRGVVVSDSMRGAGLGEGEFELGGQTTFVKDGIGYAVLQDGTIAASITNIHTEFKNLINFGIDFKTALKSCTINPSRVIGLDKEIGSIAVGKSADLVFLDEELNVKEVYIDGIRA